MCTLQPVRPPDQRGSFECFSAGICEPVVRIVSPSISLALCTTTACDEIKNSSYAACSCGTGREENAAGETGSVARGR